MIIQLLMSIYYSRLSLGELGGGEMVCATRDKSNFVALKTNVYLGEQSFGTKNNCVTPLLLN